MFKRSENVIGLNLFMYLTLLLFETLTIMIKNLLILFEKNFIKNLGQEHKPFCEWNICNCIFAPYSYFTFYYQWWSFWNFNIKNIRSNEINFCVYWHNYRNQTKRISKSEKWIPVLDIQVIVILNVNIIYRFSQFFLAKFLILFYTSK